MKIPLKRPSLKPLLPTKLFGRALLILFVPLVVLQLSVAYVFYVRHWESIVRNLSGDAANEIILLVDEYDRVAAASGRGPALVQVRQLGRHIGIDVEADTQSKPIENGAGRGKFPELYDNLVGHFPHPFMIQTFHQKDGERIIRLRVAQGGGAVDYLISRKRLASGTTVIFLFWMVGTAFLLMAIATLFLRNQIRPVVQLARAAEAFGRGQEMAGYSPRGASEIRRAGTAFLLMADRVRRSVSSRTEMLAGISHDLRTPLTRMKLELEMGKVDQVTRDALATDIEEMRRMVDEYLDFARGDAGEPMEPIDLAQLAVEVVDLYQRQGRPVVLIGSEPAPLMVRPNALKRALTNLVDNALRYGGEARISIEQTVAYVRLKITDVGPGIPEAEHETVFKPFTRLDPSRNIATGGVGLGLSIARDIAQGHGGDVTFENQRDVRGNITGLEVTLRLPRELPR